MKEYTEIVTQDELDALLDRVAGFHDSLAKEIFITNRGWVNSDGSMAPPGRRDARILIQSQWQVRAIELLLIDLLDVKFSDGGEFWGAHGTVEDASATGEDRRISLFFDRHFAVVAGRLFFVDREDWSGPRARLGFEVPAPGVVPATLIDGTWRQCSRCAGAFEVIRGDRYATCPDCGALTECDGARPTEPPP
ncbi:MAG: hypothetical protein AAGM22_08270 [Acidobacteriota bacterium]